MRLILWLLWDKLALVETASRCVDILWSFFEFVSRSGGDSVAGCIILVLETFCGSVIKYLFGTTELRLRMSDIMRHKLVCGVTGQPGQLGRVHIDNACVNVVDTGEFQVLGQVTQCYGCPLEQYWSSPGASGDINTNSSFQVIFIHVLN